MFGFGVRVCVDPGVSVLLCVLSLDCVRCLCSVF